MQHAVPSVDRVRQRLGGRAATAAGAGQIVQIADGPIGALGVVVFRSGSTVDVLIGQGTVRRTRSEHIAPIDDTDDAGGALRALAKDVRSFAALVEGDRVHFADPRDGTAEGTLVEKCRYGALVLRDDQSLVGVGFRQIQSASKDGTAIS